MKTQEKILFKLKRHIEFNSKLDIFFVDSDARDVGDVAFIEDEEEIRNASQQKKEKEFELTRIQEPDLINVIEELEEISEEVIEFFEELTIEALEKIEIKVLYIIRNINISLFQKKRAELKSVIVDDMISSFFKAKISDESKRKIIDIVSGIVDHEFKEYGRKIKQRKIEIFEDLKKRIDPFIQKSLSDYRINRYKKITESQRENYFKYLFESIETNYIQVDKKDKKINNEEYVFLRNLIKRYIKNLYRENKK